MIYSGQACGPWWVVGHLLFVLLSQRLAVLVDGSLYFSPVFHTPNDYDLNGKTCSARLPTRLAVPCPAFAINVRNSDGSYMNHQEFESECQDLGIDLECSPGQFVGLDGDCASCEGGEPNVNPDTGVLYCGDVPITTASSLTSCLGSEGAAVYRPCGGSGAASVDIPYYYKGLDLGGEVTMQHCANMFGVNDTGNSEDQHRFAGRSYSFPVLRFPDSYDQKYGFVQCPAGPPEYDFGSVGWWIGYGFYIFVTVDILIFIIYKFAREAAIKKRHRKKLESLDGSAIDPDVESRSSRSTRTGKQSKVTALEVDPNENVTLEDEGTRQLGYRNDWFGMLSFLLLWAAGIALQVFILIVILDVYGLHVWTLCSDAARADCRQAQIDSPQFNPYWREGWLCGSGCLFSWQWTSGVDPYWPYHPNNFGGEQLYAVFISAWHINLVFLVGLKFVESKIRNFFRVKFPLEDATVVLVSKATPPEVRVEADRGTWVDALVRQAESWQTKLFGGQMMTEVCKVETDSQNTRPFITFQCQRYGFSPNKCRFEKAFIPPPETHAEAKGMIAGLSGGQALSRAGMVGTNSIPIRHQPLYMVLWEECFNFYVLYQYFCLITWFAFVYWIQALLLTLLIMLSIGIKVHARWSGQRSVIRMARHFERCKVLRDGQWHDEPADILVPGDVVALSSGEVLTYDAVLVDGRCVVDESSLTGEPTPVPKAAVDAINKRYCPESNEDKGFTVFAGATVKTCVGGPDSGVCAAVVTATGIMTEKGSLIKSILYPPKLSFKFDQHWRVVFIILLAYGGVSFCVNLMFINFHISAWFYGIFTMSQIMSPLIPASFVNNQAIAAARMKAKQVFCSNMGRVYCCGKVKIFCFDKTGTMTKDGLEFKGVLTVTESDRAQSFGSMYAGHHDKEVASDPKIDAFLACCHGLDFLKDDDSGDFKPVGNEVDANMFAASGFSFQPDAGHGEGTLSFRDSEGREFVVLRRLEFDRATMTSSAVVRCLSSNATYVFTKGSYEALAGICDENTIPHDYKKRTEQLAREGNYVLGMAWKAYDGPAEVRSVERTELEKNLTTLGLLVYVNDLKEDTGDVIDHLKQGAIRSVMVTGDNALTGAKIASECGMTRAKRLLVSQVSAVTADEVEDPSAPSPSEAVVEKKGHAMNVVGKKTVYWQDFYTDELFYDLSELHDSLQSGETELVVTGEAFEALIKTPILSLSEVLSGNAELLEDIEKGEGTPVNDRHIYNSKMRDLVRFTRIFARVKPFQKIEVVEMHMQLGITGMCGDGANDAGALRMAHVGLALASGSQEATIVSSFCTSQTSLEAIVDMVRIGRASMATAVHCYKNLVMYGSVMVAGSMLQYYFGVIMSEAWWLVVDCAVNAVMTFAIMYAQPAKRLAPSRPTSKLLGEEVVLSVLFPTVLSTSILCMAIGILYTQSWFVCKEFDANITDPAAWFYNGDNYEAAVCGQLSAIMFFTSGVLYNFGFEYRKQWIENWVAAVYGSLGIVIMTVLMMWGPSWLSCLFRYNCGDKSTLERLKELGEVSSVPSNAPTGCGCDEQVAPDIFGTASCSEDPSQQGCRCEAEYVDCDVTQFQQVYHHNVIPMDFRWVLFGIIVGYIVVVFLFEGLVIVGPGRKYFRRNRDAKSNPCTKPIVGPIAAECAKQETVTVVHNTEDEVAPADPVT